MTERAETSMHLEELEIARAIGRVLFPQVTRRVTEIKQSGIRFAHYTNLAAAVSVIEHQEIWMRSTLLMNDYSEVRFGLQALQDIYNAHLGGRTLRNALNALHRGISDEIAAMFNPLIKSLWESTYIACFSEHPRSEAEFGRLSMWRCYAADGVALVLDPRPMFSEKSRLGIYSTPVEYLTTRQLEQHFYAVAESIGKNHALLAGLSRERVRRTMVNVFRFAALSMKHPGFREEAEWRVTYTTGIDSSALLREETVDLRTGRQKIYKVPIDTLTITDGDDIRYDEFIQQIIIGPCYDPGKARDALLQAFAKKGCTYDPARIVTSDIPVRLP